MDLAFLDVLKIVDDAEARELEMYYTVQRMNLGGDAALRHISRLGAIQELKQALVEAANAPVQAGGK